MALRPYVVGNWKMNGTRAMLAEARAIDRSAQRLMKVEVALAPPYTLIHAVHREAEQIGVGARWKVQRLHQVGQIKTTQTLVYSLLERQGRVLRLGVTLQQTAAPQEVPFEEGSSFQVEAYEVSGTGSMLMSLDAITPLGELRGNTDLRGLLRHGQQSEPLRASGAVQVVISPVADESAG